MRMPILLVASLALLPTGRSFAADTPLADTWDTPFAGPRNVAFAGARWSDSVSHGELLRSGYDERLEADPADLRFLYQGVLERERQGKPYGQIPWRLGILEPAQPDDQPRAPSR